LAGCSVWSEVASPDCYTPDEAVKPLALCVRNSYFSISMATWFPLERTTRPRATSLRLHLPSSWAGQLIDSSIRLPINKGPCAVKSTPLLLMFAVFPMPISALFLLLRTL